MEQISDKEHKRITIKWVLFFIGIFSLASINLFFPLVSTVSGAILSFVLLVVIIGLLSES